MEIEGLSGAVLVSRAGADLVRWAGGVADRSTGEGSTTRTRFQIASVSKQFTAAAALLLVEDEFVGLADPIGEILTACPEPWAGLTLHQLLSHTSGLGHWSDLPGFDVSRPGTPEEFLERFASVPLLSAPGAAWRYSSPGYLLAARVVEVVGGAPYARFVAERILRPVGLADTVVGRAPRDRRAWGYRGFERVDGPEFAAIPGTGDVWSTVDDLVRWTVAFQAGEILSAASRAEMVSPQAQVPGPAAEDDPAPAASYGYGFFLGTVCGQPARFHPGDNPGYQSFVAHLPESATTIVILANGQESSLDDVLRQVGRRLG